MDYSFGNKAQWRRTMWNQIVKRLQVPARDAVVLYLAGESDADRAVALRHGFRDENLIAVESEKKVTIKLRNAGILTINSDICEVCNSWTSPKVDLVYADFCCGLTLKIQDFLVAIAGLAMFSESVVAINLMRGRDAQTNEVRAHFNKALANTELKFNAKHRGVQAVLTNSAGCREHLLRRRFITADGSLVKFKNNWMTGWYCKAFHLSFEYSYKSNSGQYFDSSVFNNWSAFKCLEHWCVGGFKTPEFVHRDASPLTRQIAAVKATRTRMLKAA